MDNRVLARVQEYVSDQPNLVAVYLFGSIASGLDHAQSDVDVAILLSESPDRSAALELQLRMMADLEDICGRQVDLVVLNTASPLLCFQVFKHGRLLAERDCTARALFEMRVRSLYYDFKPYYELQVSQFTRRLRQQGLGYGYRPHPGTSS